MSRGYWLVKSEPTTYSWERFEREGQTAWDGVRNFEARNNLRTMRVGDRALFYHSTTDKAVVGVASVVRSAYPDATATEGDWSAVDLEPVQRFTTPVTLAALKADPRLAELALFRRSRLSVVPVTREHFDRIVRLGGGAGARSGRTAAVGVRPAAVGGRRRG